jgi:hypothetical protein
MCTQRVLFLGFSSRIHVVSVPMEWAAVSLITRFIALQDNVLITESRETNSSDTAFIPVKRVHEV